MFYKKWIYIYIHICYYVYRIVMHVLSVINSITDVEHDQIRLIYRNRPSGTLADERVL